MRLIITQKVANIISVARDKVTLNIYPFDTAVGRVPLSIIQAAGDLIQGTGAGAAARLAAGAAGTVPTSQGAGMPLVYANPVGGVAEFATLQGRLTLTSGTPVTTADVTAATTLYLTPFNGNRISLYDGSTWNRRVLNEISIKLSDTQTGTLNNTVTVTGLSDTTQLVVGMNVTGTGIQATSTIATIPSSTSITLSLAATLSSAQSLTFTLVVGKNYDVFAFDNSGTPKLELGTAWTSDSVRSTALVLQDGIYAKSGATTRRYVGTIRTTVVAGQCEDSLVNRLVYNYYNRVLRKMYCIEATSHAYSGAYRKWNNSDTNNLLAWVMGVPDLICFNGLGYSAGAAANICANTTLYIDGATSHAWFYNYTAWNTAGAAFADAQLAAGYHYCQIYEFGYGAGNNFVQSVIHLDILM